MKYQAIKHNKTGTRLLGLFDTLHEAHERIRKEGGRYEGRSYIGGFPVFTDEKRRTYSIQGGVEFSISNGVTTNLVVCSLNDRELVAEGLS